MYCGKCGKEIPGGMEYCPACHLQIQTQTSVRSAQNEMPMKWYKFLIYFSLFASAVVNTVMGVATIFGKHYSDFADQVYAAFPALKPVDIVMGVFTIAFGAYALYVRNRLAGYYRNGPSVIAAMYIASAAASFIYVFICSIIIGQSAFTPDIIFRTIGDIIMIIANIIYFNKRRHLFVN